MEKQVVKAFKALGEPTRMKIVKLLSVQMMCVCELSEVLDMVQPRISQHLRILKEAGLVEENREGYYVVYSLDREKLSGLWQDFSRFLEAGLEDVEGYEMEHGRLQGLDWERTRKRACRKALGQ